MTAFDAEKWADYCMPLSDDLTICGTRTVEDESARRVEYRWCFDCRTRHDFTWRIEREGDHLPLILARIHRQRDPIAHAKLAGDDLGLFGLLEDEVS